MKKHPKETEKEGRALVPAPRQERGVVVRREAEWFANNRPEILELARREHARRSRGWPDPVSP